MSNIVVLYRPNTDHEPIIRDLQFNYRHQTGKELELISLDTVEGAELAKVYDVTRYPAILARGNDGAILQMWEGDKLPLINEMSFYDSDRTKQTR